jgi:hypothetical protein
MPTVSAVTETHTTLFRERVALADRIMLAITVYSMGLGLYAVYQWGFERAATRVLLDWAALGGMTLIFVVPVLAVFTLSARWRRRAGAGLVCAAYVVGFGLWCFALFIGWDYAGAAAALTGVVCGGVGVIPVAAVGALAHGDWDLGMGIVVTAILTVAVRRYGCVAIR